MAKKTNIEEVKSGSGAKTSRSSIAKGSEVKARETQRATTAPAKRSSSSGVSSRKTPAKGAKATASSLASASTVSRKQEGSRVGVIATPDMGIKRRCLKCGKMFYDMGRTPFVCPHCGASMTPEAYRKTRYTPDRVSRNFQLTIAPVDTDEDDDTESPILPSEMDEEDSAEI